MTLNDQQTENTDGCVLALLGMLLWVPAALFEGMVLQHLWAWLIVPFGPPALPFPLAVGVFFVWKYLRAEYRFSESSAQDAKTPLERFLVMLLVPYVMGGLALLFGWVLKLVVVR